MSGRRIYLVASTGFPNYGDELVASQWLRYLAANEPDAEVWLDSPAPGTSEILLGHLHPNVRFTDTLFRICWAIPDEDPWQVVDFAKRAVRQVGFVARQAAGVEVLQGADVFHILGGGYINTLWPKHLSLIATGTVLAAEFGASASMTGLGLVPNAASASLLDRLVEGYHVVDVRDEASAALFGSDAVTNTGDDAFLDLGDHLYDDRETRSVMLCIQADLVTKGIGAVCDTVLGTLQAWAVEAEQIGYVEAMPGGDRRAFDLLEPYFPDMRFYPFTEVWNAGLPARRGQRWITTRLHPHLVAAAVGAWGVAIPVSTDYYDVKHDSLTSRGSRWAVVEPGEVATNHHGEPGFGSATAALVEAKQAVAARIYGQ